MPRRSVPCGLRVPVKHTPPERQPEGCLGRRRFRAVGMVLALSLSLVCVPSLFALDRLEENRTLMGRSLRQVFADAVEKPARGVVRLQTPDGDPLALGTIVDSEGWVLTKASQLRGDVVCVLKNGRTVSTQYVGYDAPTDLALLRIDAENLPHIEWSKASAPAVGQWLISAGTGRRPVAVGVMSVPRRAIPKLDIHGVLGIELERGHEEPIIKRVFESSAAKAAGLQPGDIITSINGDPVATRIGLIDTIREYRPGESLELHFLRDETAHKAFATLTHPFGDFLSRIAFQNQMGTPLSFRRDDFPAVFQHDSVLHPEDCGGPVVTLDGTAVGINIARAGRTESYALPADVIQPLIVKLKTGRHGPPAPPVHQVARPITDESTDLEADVSDGESAKRE